MTISSPHINYVYSQYLNVSVTDDDVALIKVWVENGIKEHIQLLKEHQEGLTILNIAKHIGVNRLTASKYIYGLISEGRIHQRKVGPAKLCYLKTVKK